MPFPSSFFLALLYLDSVFLFFLFFSLLPLSIFPHIFYSITLTVSLGMGTSGKDSALNSREKKASTRLALTQK